MKTLKLAALAACVIAAAGLTGCSSLGRAAVGELPPMDLGVAHTVTCAELVKEVRGAADGVDQAQAEAGAGPSSNVEVLRRRNTELLKSIAQTDAMISWCERRTATPRVKVNPEAARRSLGALLPF